MTESSTADRDITLEEFFVDQEGDLAAPPDFIREKVVGDSFQIAGGKEKPIMAHHIDRGSVDLTTRARMLGKGTYIVTGKQIPITVLFHKRPGRRGFGSSTKFMTIEKKGITPGRDPALFAFYLGRKNH